MEIFEPIGRFFFEKNRLWLFFVLLCAPFIAGLALLLPRFLALREVEQSFDAAAIKGRSALEKRVQKEAFLHRYMQSEPYYIDQYLESLPLLQKDLKELQSIHNHPACANRDLIQRRIDFIQGTENRLAFAEENIRTSKKIKETDERLLHLVEIDSDDLEHLLSLIEDTAIGSYTPHIRSPQLLIQDFSLTKKDRGVYELNLNLLKREFSEFHEKNN